MLAKSAAILINHDQQTIAAAHILITTEINALRHRQQRLEDVSLCVGPGKATCC